MTRNIERYWIPPFGGYIPEKSPVEFEQEQFWREPCTRQMMSDVPIGAFLSGGIDSSLVVALMAVIVSGPAPNFSVAFDEGDVDESPQSADLPANVRDKHTVLHAENLDRYQSSGPDRQARRTLLRPALLSTYALSQKTSGTSKSRSQGTEGTLGGYPKYLLGRERPYATPFPGSAILIRPQQILHASLEAGGMDRIYPRTLNSAEKIRFRCRFAMAISRFS